MSCLALVNVHLFCCAVLPVVASHSSFLLEFHLFRLFVSWGVELKFGKFLHELRCRSVASVLFLRLSVV